MELERSVAAPAAAVWAVMTDIDKAPERISGIDAVERLGGTEGFDVGTRWRETRTVFGRSATEEMAVTAIEPGRSYTVEADNRGTLYRSVVRVEPTGEQSSRLWMSFDAQPTGLAARALGATVGRLFERSTRAGLQADLDDIAAAAERHAGS